MLIAICDDSKQDAEKIRFSLMDITDELIMDYYPTGVELIQAVKSGKAYSIIFQDIYLEKENGLDIAKAVKELSPDTQIIFCTSSVDHAIDAFKVQAVDYLVKPCEETDIVKAFARVSLRINSQYSVPIVINSGKEIHVFHAKDVIKVESDKHYTIIYAQNGKKERVHSNFSDIAELFDKNFIEIRRGLIVNPSCIEKISGVVVYLTDGSSYTLPKAKKDFVTAKYIEYMTDKKTF